MHCRGRGKPGSLRSTVVTRELPDAVAGSLVSPRTSRAPPAARALAYGSPLRGAPPPPAHPPLLVSTPRTGTTEQGAHHERHFLSHIKAEQANILDHFWEAIDHQLDMIEASKPNTSARGADPPGRLLH